MLEMLPVVLSPVMQDKDVSVMSVLMHVVRMFIVPQHKNASVVPAKISVVVWYVVTYSDV